MWPRSDARKRMTKMKNRIFAIPAAAMAIPANPKIAAISATMKNPSDHLNMSPPKQFVPKPCDSMFSGQAIISRRSKGNRVAVLASNSYLVKIQQDISCDDRFDRLPRLRTRRRFDGVHVKTSGFLRTRTGKNFSIYHLLFCPPQRVIVSRHFEVSHAENVGAAMFAGKLHGAFPITRREFGGCCQFLLRQPRCCGERNH